MKRKRILMAALCLALAAALCGCGGAAWAADAQLAEAAAIVKAHAREEGYSLSQYPGELVRLLQRNPETEEFVLNYPRDKDKTHTVDMTQYSRDSVPLLMQWDSRWGYLDYGSSITALSGCGPICLSMAGYYCTGDERFAPAQVIAFAEENGYYVPGSGSSWTLISQGGLQLGLEVTEIPLVKGRIDENLSAGNPIICVMGPGDFTETGHYIVLTGLAEGGYTVNDPNSHKNSETVWSYDTIASQIRNLWVIRAG